MVDDTMNIEELWAGARFMWAGLRIGLRNWRCMLGKHGHPVHLNLPGGGYCDICPYCEEEL